jgi:GT2 family glycosyltransferase
MTDTPVPTLTISIVTANNERLILDCLRSIHESIENLETEIYVVINASSDDSEEAIRESYPQVKLIINGEKLGFTVNHNMVIRRAKGTYILVLNDDTIILDGALKKMVEFIEASPDVGILGCRILNPDGSPQWSCGNGSSHKVAIFKAGILRSFLPSIENTHYHATKDVCWVTGACLLVRAETIRQVGPFDENFVIYYEDGDLCYRVCQAGWKVVFYPHAKIIHYRGETRKQYLARDTFIIYQSRLYFFAKHCSLLTEHLVRVFTILEATLRGLRTLIARRGLGKQRQELLKTYGCVIRLALSPANQGTKT